MSMLTLALTIHVDLCVISCEIWQDSILATLNIHTNMTINININNEN